MRRAPAGVNPRTDLQTYSDDPRFLRDLAKIKRSGTEWKLFHLAVYREIKSNREYIMERQEAALLESLEQVTGKKVLRTTDYVRMPVEQPEQLKASADDDHPSLIGMRFYAGAVAEALMREGGLEPR